MAKIRILSQIELKKCELEMNKIIFFDGFENRTDKLK